MDKLEGKYYLFSEEYDKASLISFSEKLILDSEKEEWEKEIFRFILEWFDETENVIVKTSGSTGKPKAIKITKVHMTHSAQATINFLGLKPKNKLLLCLPANYIAGKMMIVRCLSQSLDLHYIKPGINPELNSNSVFHLLALTPSMLTRYLKPENHYILENYENIILGGSSIDGNTEQKLSNLKNKLWHTYGMTETITHIAMRRINGDLKSIWFSPLKNVILSKSDKGTLIIDYPEIGINKLHTNDLIELNEDKSFRVRGRIDNVIISGGMKISAEEYEATLNDIIASDFFVLGQNDEILGEKLTLFIETNNKINKSEILKRIRNLVPRNKLPKEIVLVKQFERTISGKIIRQNYNTKGLI